MNWLFSYYPSVHLLGRAFNIADILTGFVYIFRDFSQQELGHRVWLIMIIAALLSFIVAAEEVALASLIAFSVGETLDWAIFTYAKLGLSKRLLISSLVSSPVDTLLFLSMTNLLTGMQFAMMTVGKTAGVLLIWAIWRWRRARASAAQ